MKTNNFLDERGRAMRAPLFFCAGEPSGDMYAALLAAYIQSFQPHIRMIGVGGPRMQEAGITVLRPYRAMQVFGFGSALSSLSASVRAYQDIVGLLKKIRPGTFIPVAYPGLNLLLCRQAKKLGAEVHYFLPPQIWAWGMFRTHFVRMWVDRVISIFPFEHRLYRALGVNSVFVHNPLERTLGKYRRTDRRPCIGFMPGSRLRDARRQLPVMSRIAAWVLRSHRDVRCVFIVPERDGRLHTAVQNTAEVMNRRFTGRRVLVNTEKRYAAMKNCDLLVISSGTASLEAFLMHIPQVFMHKPSFVDYHILRPFLRIKEYNLVNLLQREEQVPTCVHRNVKAIIRFIQQNLQHAFFD